MKVVDRTRLLGNFAEAHVASLLAAGGCLVRPFASATEVGADLHCETPAPRVGRPADPSPPYLHFLVRVKVGSAVKLGDDQARCAFELRELEYWSRQPIPVFVALVATDWPPTTAPTVWLLDVGAALPTRGQPITGMTLATTCAIAPGDPAALRAFLDDQVPAAVAAVARARRRRPARSRS